MGVYFWQDVPYRTFTISWEEKSDMSSWWTYSDQAAWLTAGSTDFDEFFWYSGVRLSSAWVETAEITQAQSWWAWKLDLSQLWTLSSGNNVMIKFPVRWIKMTKIWSIITLSITDWLNREAEWFQYYAHSRGTLSNPIRKNNLYIWAFKSKASGTAIKSLTGTISTSIKYSDSITKARANDGNTGDEWYDIIWFYPRMYVDALYMMKYWNPNSQVVVGRWLTGGSAKASSWTTVSQLSATYWTTSTWTQMKLFWLEDRWGNTYEWLWWIYTDGSRNLWAALSWFTTGVALAAPYENTGVSMSITSGRDISSIAWNNKWMFVPNATVNNSNYDTYYCDTATVSSTSLAATGGYWWDGLLTGAFSILVNYNSTWTWTAFGARIMYL